MLTTVYSQVFRLSTKRMEGNTPSGSFLLPEYLRVHETLSNLLKETTFPSLQQMIKTMLSQLEKYQAEAADAQVIILATILNPKYRLKFVDLHYSNYASQAKKSIEELFELRLDSWPATPPGSPGPTPSTASLETLDRFDMFTSSASFQTSSTIRAAELDSYLQGNHPIVPGQSELSWWRVSPIFLSTLTASNYWYSFWCYRRMLVITQFLLPLLRTTSRSQPRLVL